MHSLLFHWWGQGGTGIENLLLLEQTPDSPLMSGDRVAFEPSCIPEHSRRGEEEHCKGRTGVSERGGFSVMQENLVRLVLASFEIVNKQEEGRLKLRFSC